MGERGRAGDAGMARLGPEQPRRGCAHPAPRTKEHEATAEPGKPRFPCSPPRPHGLPSALEHRKQRDVGMWCPPAPACQPGSASAASRSVLGPAMDPTDELAEGLDGLGARGLGGFRALRQPAATRLHFLPGLKDTKSFLALVDVLED